MLNKDYYPPEMGVGLGVLRLCTYLANCILPRFDVGVIELKSQ